MIEVNKRHSKSSHMSTTEKESVEIQYQTNTGSWIYASTSSDNSDANIFNAVRNVQKRIANVNNSNGHIRAKGKKTGRIYDMRGWDGNQDNFSIKQNRH